MKSLYRRYRPRTLNEVVGQEQVTLTLQKSLEQGKINHAYLFVGPRGCGKTSVARILAHQINDFDYELEDDYVDIIEIDGASNRGIDNIRDLREKVMIAPTAGKYKVYIIDEVHMLTKEAFNALLKTLEEPPEHAVFIMATTDAYKVPVTITSRSQVYTFKLANLETIFDFLSTIARKEKIAIDDDALTIIAKRSGGSFRDALSLLDQLSTLSEKHITKEMVIAAMGLPQDEKITELLLAYLDKDISQITGNLKSLLSSGVKAETLTEELIMTIVADPKSELMPLLAKLPEVKAPFAEARLLVALLPQNSAKITQPPKQPVFQQPISKQAVSEQIVTVPATENSFVWSDFLEKVKESSGVVYLQLTKTKYEFLHGVLHIYPLKKITKNILSKDNNRRILQQAIDGVEIIIHEIDETPTDSKKDETLSRISDIMGGEVQNDGGGSPF